MKNLVDDNIDNEGSLVDVPAGSYLRVGSDSPALAHFHESTKGIIVNSYLAQDRDKKMLVVLVKGELINLWEPERSPSSVG